MANTQFLTGQVISFRHSPTGGWGIIVAQGNDERRFFAHGKAFLDGPPEVYSLVMFEPRPADGDKLPRAKRISVIATPDANDEPRQKAAKKSR
jgi:hypothetical protein